MDNFISWLFYVIRNKENGKYLARNDNYKNDRTTEFYESSIKSAYLFEDLIKADKVLKEYDDTYEIRKINLCMY